MKNTSTHPAKSAASPELHDCGMLRGALGLAALTLVGCGFMYSLAGVGLGQTMFPAQAEGSMIVQDGKIVGSVLVAQPFASASYFHPRPSAANYDPMTVVGSNAARTSPDLRSRLDVAKAAIALREGIALEEVPSDLATQSGAGIDPHISPQAALIQVARVARERRLEPDKVARLVEQHTEAPQLGLLGQPRVNVLKLNLALDQLGSPRKPAGA